MLANANGARDGASRKSWGREHDEKSAPPRAGLSLMPRMRSTAERLQALAIGETTIVRGRLFSEPARIAVNDDGERVTVTRCMGMTFTVQARPRCLAITRQA